jgi:hypothetical protein
VPERPDSFSFFVPVENFLFFKLKKKEKLNRFLIFPALISNYFPAKIDSQNLSCNLADSVASKKFINVLRSHSVRSHLPWPAIAACDFSL